MPVLTMERVAKAAWGVRQVGEVAGQVWQCLRRLGKTNVAVVERQIKSPAVLTQMAIGWLAREGKLDLRQSGRSVEVWLTE